MSTSLETPTPEQTSKGLPATPVWLRIAVALLAVVLVYALYAHFGTRASLISQIQAANAKVAALEGRAATLEDQYADTKAELDVTTKKLGLTREELERARALAQQSRQEQRQLAERLGVGMEEQKKELGALTGEVGGVKEEVDESRRELQRAVGDLGEQSGLIASNRQELEQLKRLGERDYFEFELAKAQGLMRVGPMSLRLNKTDAKRQKFTLTVIADDKQIEKKDKTLLEPVQFYVPGTRSLREIVVYEVGSDRVAGYVSMPKELVSRK